MANYYRVDSGEFSGLLKSDQCSAEGSVTQWINDCRGRGDERAANQLFRRYFDRLIARMKDRVNRKLQAVSDSEDVASFALSEVLRRLQAGRYPNLCDRESLWTLMMSIAETRCREAWRNETAAKRDVTRTAGQGEPEDEHSGLREDPCDSREFGTGFLTEMEDLLQHIVGHLGDDYRELLILNLQGYSPAEVEERMQAAGFPLGQRQILRKKDRLRKELMLAS